MNSLIVGQGEIGKAVKEVISGKDKVSTYDKNSDDSFVFDVDTDVLHICFPYTEEFVSQVKYYIKEAKPWHVIIWSTVPIGTTSLIAGAVHSPVEGKHPKLARSIKDMTRWIGADNKAEGAFFEQYFKDKMLVTKLVDKSVYTEFLKLRSTSKFGINLVWTDYEANVARELGMDPKLIRIFDRDYNKLYHNLNMPEFQRYILRPPNGRIGGHCVVPNARLLNEQFPNELLKMIEEME